MDEQLKDKKIKEKRPNLKNKKLIVISCVVTIILISVAIFSVIFALININNDKIIGKVFIDNVEVSGMTKEEAKRKMESIIEEKKDTEIPLMYEEYTTSITPAQIDVEYNIEKAVKQAYEIGRSSNIIVNNYTILGSILAKRQIEMELTYNQEELKKKIFDISAKLPGAVMQSSYYIDMEQTNLVITKGKEGLRIKEELLSGSILKTLSDFSKNAETILIPTQIVQPKEINIQKIHEEVYKEPKDAYVTKDPIKLYPHIEGVDFAISIEEAEELIKENKDEYVIPLKIIKPSITTDKLGSEAFPELISTFSTKYDAGNKARSTNLALAASKINGTVINPGEIFSYNKVVGERTIAAGYKEAKIYENGKVVDGLGGGICQISSTLYNTALYANLEIVSRRNHQFLTSYVGPGRDATVVYGSTDFKFKNTRTYPIKLVCSVKNGIAKISIYGIKEETEYKVDIKTTTTATIPYSTTYIEDKTMEAGTEVVKQKGASGCRSETYRIISLDGKVVSKTLLSKDTYNPMEKIVTKGTKNVQNANAEQKVEKEQDKDIQSTENLPVNSEVPVEPQEEEPVQQTQPSIDN